MGCEEKAASFKAAMERVTSGFRDGLAATAASIEQKSKDTAEKAKGGSDLAQGIGLVAGTANFLQCLKYYAILLTLSVWLMGIDAYAAPIVIEVTAPKKAGTATFEVFRVGKAKETVDVPLAGNETDMQKAEKIRLKMINQGINAVSPEGNQVAIEAQKVKWKTNTEESIKLEDPTDTGLSIEIGYEGGGAVGSVPGDLLSGLDSSGASSRFQVSLGFQGLSGILTTTVDFSALPPGTMVDAILTMEFNDLRSQLPSFLQPNLGLDLVNNLITFTFPANALNPFVQNLATDTMVTSVGSLVTDVPEPSTLPLVFLGALGLILLRSRRA